MLDRKMAAGELTAEQKIELPELALIAAALEHLQSRGRSWTAPTESGGRRQGWRRAARHEGLRSRQWS